MTSDSTLINLIVVLGPTASGKTRLGVGIAGVTGGEIISADSRQVYRGMDIGTGKDLSEYGRVPYHLIDICDPGEEFSLFHFQREAIRAWEDILRRGRLPLLVGGTGLYLESLLRGHRLVEAPVNNALRAELAQLAVADLKERLQKIATRLHNTTDLLDRERVVRAIEIAEHEQRCEPEPLPEIKPLIFGIRWERTILRQRITARLKERLQSGMIDEVARLHDAGISWERLDYFGLEYRYIAGYLRGETNRNDMFQKLNSAIHDFAKRQETWFRRMERNGAVIHWLDGDHDPLSRAKSILDHHGLAAHAC
ncbi:tRNA dimethylallyltransferase 1 [Geobacter sp. OR-1]|uniref:tRNA (adenosine(37)-N6)-dimethylallyltransferase MiaA n=1 Tax=Geobacter sp. OR-1 TaxID=1266765 RepID=UPI000543623C|nr:tRNA dimethylallyltransferase 1 [Geobacter sp. OR-1]